MTTLTIVVMCPMMCGASSLNSDDGIGSLPHVFAVICGKQITLANLVWCGQ